MGDAVCRVHARLVMTMASFCGRLVLRLFGWRLVGTVPPISKFVFIGAPHTSNWDLLVMLAAGAALKVRIRWLAKHTVFWGALGWILRALGGFPVDRRVRHDLVEDVVQLFGESDTLRLGIAPEGSRSRRDHWKSGFYYIARGANVPVVVAFLDYATRRCGVGGVIELTGDVSADMDRIRACYGSFQGRYPELQGPIRLRDERHAIGTVSGRQPGP